MKGFWYAGGESWGSETGAASAEVGTLAQEVSIRAKLRTESRRNGSSGSSGRGSAVAARAVGGLALLVLAVVWLYTTLSFLGTSPARAAGAGSPPSLPPPNLPGTPPGGGQPILSVTPIPCGSNGMNGPLTVSGTVDGLSYSVSLSAGTFSCQDPLELVVTSCNLAALGNEGFPGYTPYACLGYYVVDMVSGLMVSPPWNPPVCETLAGPQVQPPPRNLFTLYVFSNGTWQQTQSVQANQASSCQNGPAYVSLLAQNIASTTAVVPGATPQTGQPVLGEEVGAGLLIAAGIAGLVGLFFARRRRARSSGEG
jgi:hypothetical protein